jgi:hypothetical protein
MTLRLGRRQQIIAATHPQSTADSDSSLRKMAEDAATAHTVTRYL